MISRRMLVAVLSFTFVLTSLTVLWAYSSRSAYESSQYTVVERDGDFEIRDYPELCIVSTKMSSDLQGRDGSFTRLFRYIRGSNVDEQKIEMTVPVFMEQPSNQQTGEMVFVLPKTFNRDDAPEPADDEVRLAEREGGQYAVIRFSGQLNRELVDEHNAKLRNWMAEKGVEPSGDPVVAVYDPPWTPGPLRRNEVLFRLKAADTDV